MHVAPDCETTALAMTLAEQLRTRGRDEADPGAVARAVVESRDGAESAKAIVDLGAAKYLAGEPHTARQLWRLVASGPHRPAALLAATNLGLLYEHEGDLDRAVQSLRMASAHEQGPAFDAAMALARFMAELVPVQAHERRFRTGEACGKKKQQE